MPDKPKQTTNIKDIECWVEARGGKPAVVKSGNGERTELLRIDFGEKEESLEPISWEEFEKIFKKHELVFLFQERTADGGESRFFKFVAKAPN